jgi:hypothetical protein
MRTQRNNITLDVDSALALMQEIYNDVVENRNTASQILRNDGIYEGCRRYEYNWSCY